MEEILTERLRLRPLLGGDLPAFVAYRSDPDVARYQGWDAPYAMADAQALVAEQCDVAFGTPGIWLQIAAVDLADGTLHGDCAVHVLAEHEQPATAEVGVTFATASQGRGLATEALGAVVTALFERRHLHRVFAESDDRNAAVHALLERLGFRQEAGLVEADHYKGEWTTLRVHAVLAREWPRSRRP
jgi:aminoglycoside 6'-N-acetyltransferase